MDAKQWHEGSDNATKYAGKTIVRAVLTLTAAVGQEPSVEERDRCDGGDGDRLARAHFASRYKNQANAGRA